MTRSVCGGVCVLSVCGNECCMVLLYNPQEMGGQKGRGESQNSATGQLTGNSGPGHTGPPGGTVTAKLEEVPFTSVCWVFITLCPEAVMCSTSYLWGRKCVEKAQCGEPLSKKQGFGKWPPGFVSNGGFLASKAIQVGQQASWRTGLHFGMRSWASAPCCTNVCILMQQLHHI